jgi:juvenile hormone acid methyltransferase
MADAMTAVNPFLDRIPTELHEQYMADLLTELIKLNMPETNKNKDDGGISYKYGNTVAFARKI